MKSVVTDLIVSAADTVYMYFQRYPLPVPAPVSLVSTNAVALVPVGLTVDATTEPLSALPVLKHL